MTPAPAPLLVMQGVQVAPAEGPPILHGVDLHVARAEVIGESGAGKSTIGLATLGLCRPGCRVTAGRVAFDGVSLFDAPETAVRRLRGNRIAYVAQSALASFNPARKLLAQTIEASLAHGLMSRDAAISKAKDLYATLQLADPARFGERYPHQVSGGQLQRAMIAMALMSDPDLIVFDEPTTALDVTTQFEVLRSVKSLVESRHMSAIYITHDLALVTQIAHRILVLRYGRVVECASTREMLADPRDPYTRSLWSVRQLRKAPGPGGGALLALAGIRAEYGNVTVLHGIDMVVQRNRTLALVGESGSGKSTIAKVITGILPPGAGTTTFGDTILPRALRRRSRDQPRRIQLIHQNPDSVLNPRRTVAQTLGRPLAVFQKIARAGRREKVAELLGLVGLPVAYLNRRPGELSGGEKQRVAIARAIAAKPDLIICDEVTSSLDQVVQKEVLELLNRLQRELGITYVFITHDLATVRAIADDVVVLRHGRVVRGGSRDAVLSPPFDPYTALLISSVPEIDPEWMGRMVEERKDAVLF